MVDDGDTSSDDAVAIFAALGASDPSAVTIAAPVPDASIANAAGALQPGGGRSLPAALTRLFLVQGADAAPQELTGPLSKRQLQSDSAFAVVADNRCAAACTQLQCPLELVGCRQKLTEPHWRLKSLRMGQWLRSHDR